VALEPTLGHRLNHNIDIGGVVEVAVRDDDGAEVFRFELPFVCLDNAAWSRVNQYLRATQVQPQAARGQNLGDYHKSGTAGTEESYRIGYLFSSFHADFTIADDRDYYNAFDPVFMQDALARGGVKEERSPSF
jgi:hypothetical protein